MREIPEQQIAAMAPNANAVNNARKIVKSGGFTEHARSEDDTFYMGSCKGSGSSAYRVTLDFADNDAPVCRCSCPSRQFPCKHGLALMMELSQGRHWDICDIPQDILDKRAKKDVRAGKKESQGDRPRAPKKTNQAARTKKLKKQLEGLDLAEKVVRELVEAGLGTLNGTSVKVYQDLAKQLGDYYLPGPQRLVQSLVLEVSRLKEDGKGDYKEAVRILVFLRALIKKSRAYLTEKLEQGQVEDDASVLYEELGGIWNLDRLIELGLKKENVRLLQLSFHVSYDGARRELVDKGWWLDLDSGEIDITYNYRPVKALKYVKEEDSVTEALRVPMLVYYPGENGRRIRCVEIVSQAIKDARRNAEINGIHNAEFFVGKAEEVLPEQFEKKHVHADVIVVDPPRKGCDAVCLDTILKMRPERVVYVSCDSATLARDLRYLADGGYVVERGKCCDMFPGTVHVETVALLVRKP